MNNRFISRAMMLTAAAPPAANRGWAGPAGIGRSLGGQYPHARIRAGGHADH